MSGLEDRGARAAEAAARRRLELVPANADFRSQLAWSLVAQRRFDDALPELEKTIARAFAAASKDKDVVVVDTAGRLHTHANLMKELEKVHKVAGREVAGAPHEVLLVLDATTGQNAIQQAQLFKDALPVSGIVLTKLDGTAKGGVILGIVDQHQVPIEFIGVGERVEDHVKLVPAEVLAKAFSLGPPKQDTAAYAGVVSAEGDYMLIELGRVKVRSNAP